MDSSDWYQISVVKPQSKHLSNKLQENLAVAVVPNNSLGTLTELVFRIGQVFGSSRPFIMHPVLHLFAADHGIAEYYKVLQSKETTAIRVLKFLHDTAPSQLFSNTQENNPEIKIIDVGVAHSFEGTLSYWLHHGSKVLSRKMAMGSQSFLKFPAMQSAATLKAMETGKKITESHLRTESNTIGLSAIAEGNTCSVVALTCALYNLKPEDVVEESDPKSELVKQLVNKALRSHPLTHDVVTNLSLYGGFEIAAICGAILTAAKNQMLIILDGLSAIAALLVAQKINPLAKEYCLLSDCGGALQQSLAKRIGINPLLNLELSPSEGTGFSFALPMLQKSLLLLRQSKDESI